MGYRAHQVHVPWRMGFVFDDDVRYLCRGQRPGPFSRSSGSTPGLGAWRGPLKSVRMKESVLGPAPGCACGGIVEIVGALL